MALKYDEVRNIMALIFPHDHMDYNCHVLLPMLQNTKVYLLSDRR